MKKISLLFTILFCFVIGNNGYAQNTPKDLLLNSSFTWNDNGKYLGIITFTNDGFAQPSWSTNLIHKWQIDENNDLLVSTNGTQYVARLKCNIEANIFYGGRDASSKTQDGVFTIMKKAKIISRNYLNNAVFTWKDNGHHLGTITFSADGFAYPSWSTDLIHKWQLEENNDLLVSTNGTQYVARLKWDIASQSYEGGRDVTSKTQDGVFTVVTKLFETSNNINDYILNNGRLSLYGIYFNSGKFEIMPESKETLKKISEYLNNNTEKRFYIVGHTDNAGNFTENKELSENRAKAVLDKLVSKYNVNKEQLISFGVSSLSPVTSNITDEGKRKNRRVEIVEQ